MTKKDFLQLTPHQQEDFLNNGGLLSIDETLEQVDRVDSGFHSSPESISKSADVVSLPIDVAQASEITSSQPAPFLMEGHDGFNISDPVELLFLLDDDIASGKDKLHDWQIQILMDFAKGDRTQYNPFQAILCACNGAGKDRLILAPCVVWLSMRYKNTISPVTSSSGAQLDNQTCRYIKALCEAANHKFNSKIWNCKYREYSLDFGDGSISYIYCYATDEPKKAEGYHPAKSDSKMGIFVSEDKSVPDDINTALNKCTGYTHRLHVSTPALPIGHFYDYWSIAVDRKSIREIIEISNIDWIKYNITAFNCPHLSKNYIEQMKRDLPGGELGSAYKSQVLAEFGSTDEMVVIPYTYIWKATRNHDKKIWHKESFNTAGLDLSDGGAETVLLIRNGNKTFKIIPFKFDNTQDTLAFLEEQFRENDLNHQEALIFADCCGIGKPMLDALKRRGWSNIRFVDSRNAARQPKVYKNKGTELFFHTRKLLERDELIVINDPLLVKQLSSRYYKLTQNNVHQLLTKLEQRSRGYPSPDRADAFNLAFWNYKSTFVEPETVEGYEKPFEKVEEDSLVVGDFSLKNWASDSQRKWKANEGQTDFGLYEDEIASYNRTLQNKQKQLI